MTAAVASLCFLRRWSTDWWPVKGKSFCFLSKRSWSVKNNHIVAALSLSLFRSSIATSVGVTTLVRPRFPDGVEVEVCDGVEVLVLGPRFSSSDSRWLSSDPELLQLLSNTAFSIISLFQVESDVNFVPVSFLSLFASVPLQITAYQTSKIRTTLLRGKPS